MGEARYLPQKLISRYEHLRFLAGFTTAVSQKFLQPVTSGGSLLEWLYHKIALNSHASEEVRVRQVSGLSGSLFPLGVVSELWIHQFMAIY